MATSYAGRIVDVAATRAKIVVWQNDNKEKKFEPAAITRITEIGTTLENALDEIEWLRSQLLYGRQNFGKGIDG